MAQEFTINSEAIETKINQLLPSQGGYGAGIDFSASTMVIPVVDLTETAEGSSLRQDLQSALSHGSIEPFDVSNTTTTIINTTGYYRVFGSCGGGSSAGPGVSAKFILNDGTTDKQLVEYRFINTSAQDSLLQVFDFIVFLAAGDSLKAETDSSVVAITGSTRQIADISGNLVNPI
jgi:hypothetical protein